MIWLIIQYIPLNEEIGYIGDVRQIDEKNGKLIGIYPIAEARYGFYIIKRQKISKGFKDRHDND